MANENLHKAKAAKMDEFYTQLSDIERELKHYREHFKGKVVYCNCDDPMTSHFFQYFSLNFKELELKKLITTCYSGINGNSGSSFCLMYNGEQDGNNMPDFSYIDIQGLEGDGDFRSPECVELLKQADIVVTNPPFSLFREFVDQLVRYEKQFLIIGNTNAITYKDVFSLIKEDKLWLGVNDGGTMEFAVPDYYPNPRSGYRTTENGVRVVKIFARWFTNLDTQKRHEELILYRTYKDNEQDYPKYDNYNAIEVSKIKDIPMDYTGVMGVPISFLDKYNPNQFAIVKFRKGDDDKDLIINGHYPYFRILVKNKRVY